MYGHTARQAILRVLKEAPELADLRTEKATWAKIRDQRTRKLADRLLVELWMMGFSVAARRPADHAPVNASRNERAHADWRNSKLNPPPKTTQSDVEDRAQEPSETA